MKKNNIIKYPVLTLLRIFFACLCVLLVSSFWINQDLDYLYFSVLCLWLHNLLCGYGKFKKYLLYIFFHFTFFLFLMTKPLFAILRGESWANVIYSQFAKNADIEAMLLSMFLSLLFIWLGAWIGEHCKTDSRQQNSSSSYGEQIRKIMRMISLIAFLISGVFTLATGIEKVAFIQRHTYFEYYAQFQTTLPYIVRVIATFSKYSFCLYLASLPDKRQAFLPSCLFVMMAFPDLLVGARGKISLNILLVFFYYLLRDSWTGTRSWFGKIERRLVYILAPAAAIFMGAYVDIRAGHGIKLNNLLNGVLSFLDQQGITFQYMCAGMGNIEQLPSHQNYAFGSLIDYFAYGSIGRLLNGTQPLSNTNSIARATNGNSYAHHMSYILLKERYLNGEGMGSCYINEIFADFSYIGIVIFSVLIGFLLVYFVIAAQKNIWCAAILLLSFTGIIYMPRAEFIGSISYIMQMQFLAIVMACYLAVYLLGRKFIYRIDKERLNERKAGIKKFNF